MRPLGWIGEPNTTPTLGSHASSIQSPLLMGWSTSYRQECRRHCGLFNPGKLCFTLVVRTQPLSCRSPNQELQKPGNCALARLVLNWASQCHYGYLKKYLLCMMVPCNHPAPCACPRRLYQLASLRRVASTTAPAPALTPGLLGASRQAAPAQAPCPAVHCRLWLHLQTWLLTPLPSPLLASPCRQRGESGSHNARLASRCEDAVPLLTPQHATTITSGLPGSHAAPHLHLKP